MKKGEFRNILIVLLGVYVALAAGISNADKKLESQSCECAKVSSGTIECIFVDAMDLRLEGPAVTASVRTCRYKGVRQRWDVALDTGMKMKVVEKRCVMCYMCKQEGMECLKLPKGKKCPTIFPPLV
ncbi:hypothetical protein LSAT2_005993 [Lamellibrachia satsuma]|nr:hypothetical protein LSAT2_005993 [Lamellibrachia satsuma]